MGYLRINGSDVRYFDEYIQANIVRKIEFTLQDKPKSQAGINGLMIDECIEYLQKIKQHKGFKGI